MRACRVHVPCDVKQSSWRIRTPARLSATSTTQLYEAPYNIA